MAKDTVEISTPCWYEISWQEGKKKGIILRIHKSFILDVIEKLNINLKEIPFIKDMREDLNLGEFGEFSSNFKGDIGFGRTFKNKGEKNNFVEFLARIPYRNKSLAKAISATFTALSPFFRDCKIDTGANKPQLLTINTMSKNSAAGFSLSGVVKPSLYRILLSMGNTEVSSAVEAMKTAYDQMVGIHRYDRFSFGFKVKNGALFIDCPGNAAGIFPENYQGERGYELSSHNIDTAEQQITLLAGLAALCDEARKKR